MLGAVFKKLNIKKTKIKICSRPTQRMTTRQYGRLLDPTLKRFEGRFEGSFRTRIPGHIPSQALLVDLVSPIGGSIDPIFKHSVFICCY